MSFSPKKKIASQNFIPSLFFKEIDTIDKHVKYYTPIIDGLHMFTMSGYLPLPDLHPIWKFNNFLAKHVNKCLEYQVELTSIALAYKRCFSKVKFKQYFYFENFKPFSF